jgi:hypothetical protein
MRRIVAAGLIACASVSLVFATDTLSAWRPLEGATYKIFAGDTVAYSEVPTAKDRKLSVLIKGQPAKEVFDSIGPDDREICSTANGDRERSKGAVQCTYTASKANEPWMGYRCWIGVNLVDGKGIPTVSC